MTEDQLTEALCAIFEGSEALPYLLRAKDRLERETLVDEVIAQDEAELEVHMALLRAARRPA